MTHSSTRRASPTRRRLLGLTALAALAVASVGLAGCSSDSTSAGRRFRPAEDGVLTVATAYIPAPAFWMPNFQTYAGFEAGLAYALADRLDLAEVRVVQVPFADIVAGDLGGADLAISTLTPTAEREDHLDFTSAYVDAPPAVLVRDGTTASDAQDLKDLRWGVVEVSTLTEVVRDRIRPEAEPVELADRTAELDALARGRVDAVLLDLPVAQGIATSSPSTYDVAGQLSGSEHLAVALPAGSPNLEAVDSAVRALRSNGTVDRLAKRWLGGTGGKVRLIRVAD